MVRGHGHGIRSGRTGSLGTFGGVFTPSILTILGIILFMRLGYVVGSAGLRRALVIIALANVISVLTTFSLSAIATNLKVKGGGDYYLISRTLGVEFGGAIGIVLFLAQSVSIAFYCIGFGEITAASLAGANPYLPRIIAAGAAAFLFVFAWLGAEWATKLQYLVMAVLAASLVSFFAGGISHFDGSTLARNWSADPGGEGFWLLFAIFFPAVTGFTQGVSMSGDLKDSGRSLPLGTFLAVGVSVLVYFGAAVVLAAGLPFESLRTDYGAMNRLALFGPLVTAGVVAATLSSAMASFLGAPRILQSLARDRVFPLLSPFSKGSGPSQNPRRGVLLSAAIAFVTIGLGNLNLVAPVVSMFFLISYGLLNYATFYEARAASPSFRPRFRWFDLRLSLLGALICLGTMLAVNPFAGLMAIAVLVALHQYLMRTAGPARWADSKRSYHFQRLREHLFAIEAEREHSRDWRPRLLVFSKEPSRREQLLRFSSWLEGGSGLTTAVQIVEGKGAKMEKLREEAAESLRSQIADLGVEAFGLALSAPDFLTGARLLIQSHGIGPVRANTIVLNWIEQLEEAHKEGSEIRYGRHLQTAIRLGCNIVVLDSDKEEWNALIDLAPRDHRIDVWWWNDDTSRLMLLLAYLMSRSETWSEAKIRLLARSSGQEKEKVREDLEEMLEEARIDAEPIVLDEIDPAVMEEWSARAALVFLPLRLRKNQPVDPFGNPPEDLFKRLPVVAMTLAAGDIHLDEEPEDGEAGERAALQDSAARTLEKAEKRERDARHAAEAAEKKRRKFETTVASGADMDEQLDVKAEALEARDEAEKAARKAAEARARAEEAARAAREPDRTRPGKGNGH